MDQHVHGVKGAPTVERNGSLFGRVTHLAAASISRNLLPHDPYAAYTSKPFVLIPPPKGSFATHAELEERLLLIRNSEKEHFKMHFGDKMALCLASFTANWKPLLTFVALCSAWTAYNLVKVFTGGHPPDPQLLFINYLTSALSALSAPTILIGEGIKRNRDLVRRQFAIMTNTSIAEYSYLTLVNNGGTKDDLTQLRTAITTYRENTAEGTHVPMKLGERIASGLTNSIASWGFIILTCAGLAGWAGANGFSLSISGSAMDPYPYVYANFFLSFLSSITAPIVSIHLEYLEKEDRRFAKEGENLKKAVVKALEIIAEKGATVPAFCH